MRLDPILRAHAFVNVQRPPEIWEADTEDVRFLPLVSEMIATGLGPGGGDPSKLTLLVSNITVMPNDAEREPGWGPVAGDYVGVTISGPGDWGAEGTWQPTTRSSCRALQQLNDYLEAAGAQYAYVRSAGATGSITVFLRRRASG